MDAFAEATINGNNKDIWSGFGASAVQPEPNPSGYTVWLDSSSANDAAGGSGARTVGFQYIDTSYNQQLAGPFTLQGTTAFATTVTDCIFIQEFYALTVGSGLVAAGDVDALDAEGGNVVSRILANGNYAMSTMRLCPDGYQYRVEGWHGDGVAATTKECILRPRGTFREGTDEPPGVNEAGVYHFKATGRVKDSAIPWRPFAEPVRVPARATFKISGWASGSIDISAGWTAKVISL